MIRWSWSEFRFADPWFLLLLLLLPLLIWHERRKNRRWHHGLLFPPGGLLKQLRQPGVQTARQLLFAMKLAGIGMLVLAFARPQMGTTEEDILTEGVDIIMALDCSGSMAAEDFHPSNRITVAKQEVHDFIQGRRSDRIGLVIFAARSFTKCPLTVDYDVLIQQVEDVRLGTIQDGTAIGNGLATAINRLRASQAKSRVIILLTDGINNTGEIDPLTAAEIGRSLGIKIYTIGVGKEGVAPMPVDDPVMGRRYVEVEVQIDEDLLKKIAQMTGGQYYRAVDRDYLDRIFKTIDGLEKTKMSVKEYTHYDEKFPFFLWPSLALIVAASGLSHTRFRILP